MAVCSEHKLLGLPFRETLLYLLNAVGIQVIISAAQTGSVRPGICILDFVTTKQ